MAGDDPRGEVGGGPGRPVALPPPMPLQEVRVEVVERPEERDRRLHETSEQRHPEAEVRGRDGRRAVVAHRSLHGRAVLGPARGRDDEPPAAGLERGRHVGRDRVAARCLDDEVRPGQPRRIVRPGRWPAEDVDAGRVAAAAAVDATARRPPVAGGRLDRAAEPAVTEDEHRVHEVGPFHQLWRGPPGRRSCPGHEKAAVTVVVPRPLEPPFPGGPGSSVERAG